MFFKNCGNQIIGNQQFCIICGNKTECYDKKLNSNNIYNLIKIFGLIISIMFLVFSSLL